MKRYTAASDLGGAHNDLAKEHLILSKENLGMDGSEFYWTVRGPGWTFIGDEGVEWWTVVNDALDDDEGVGAVDAISAEEAKREIGRLLLAKLPYMTGSMVPVELTTNAIELLEQAMETWYGGVGNQYIVGLGGLGDDIGAFLVRTAGWTKGWTKTRDGDSTGGLVQLYHSPKSDRHE